MSNSKKITDLAAYTDSQVQSNDLLFITDIAAQETKKITAIDIADYAFNAKSASIFNGNYTGSFTGSFSGSFKGNLTGTSSWATNALVADSVSGGTGEVNTASNTGSYGYGLVSNKVGVDLRFKQLGAGNNVNIDLDTGDANVLRISAISTLTSPGGETGNIQFNSNAGTFGGNTNLSWDTTNNNKLIVVGNVSSTNFSSSITNAVGYFGTGSFAISSSNTISSSYALSSSHSKYAITASYLDSGGSPFAFSHASWTATVAGVITPLTSYNVSSITLYGTQPTVAAYNNSRYADVVFSTPVGSANYTVLSYCSWNDTATVYGSPYKHFADIGTSIVSARTSTGFRVTTFVGWYAGSAGDGDDYWFNTSIFPDYSSFVVFK